MLVKRKEFIAQEKDVRILKNIYVTTKNNKKQKW